MKYILTLIVFTFFIHNSTKKNEEIFCVMENSKLVTSIIDSTLNNGFFPIYKIEKDSSSSVFLYKKKVIDFETSETEFVFEVKNANLDSFVFQNEEILSTKALYTYKDGNTFVVDSVNFRIHKGVINGNRINQKMWKVNFNVEVTDTECGNRKFDFVLNGVYHVCN